MSSNKLTFLLIHGWKVFAHPLFLVQLEVLSQQVDASKRKESVGNVKKNTAKLLAAITKLAFDVIPQDPARTEYRQRASFGDDHKYWCSASVFQQHRVFFRYHAPSKIIVLAWVNYEDAKRSYANNDDAYRLFHKMFECGHPPDDWDQLLDEARAEGQRLQRFAVGVVS